MEEFRHQTGSMYSFFNAFVDILFPPSPEEKTVRDATFEELRRASAPQLFQNVRVLALYRTPLIHVFIRQVKFYRNARAIALLGQLLGEYLKETIPRSGENVYLIPIPLSSERMRERGYNQTILIAEAALAHAPGIHVEKTLLWKARHTPPQTSLSRAERLENLKSVFAVGEYALPLDTHIIVFDDITTTGSTLAEASRTLKTAGFTHVDRLALTH